MCPYFSSDTKVDAFATEASTVWQCGKGFAGRLYLWHICAVVFLKKDSLLFSNICYKCFVQAFPVEDFGMDSGFIRVLKGETARLVTLSMKNVLLFPSCLRKNTYTLHYANLLNFLYISCRLH